MVSQADSLNAPGKDDHSGLKPAKKRLMSLDALRGFDMFWILGGEGLFAALLVLTGWSGWQWFDGQMHHSQWHGFTFYDVIFPLFIFLSGVALGLSPKRLDKLPFAQRIPLYRHAFKRLGLLILLGVLYNHGWGAGAPLDPEQVRYASVLARIGFAWFIGAMLVWHTSLRVQIFSAVAILIGYGLVQLFMPFPNGQTGQFTQTGSINAYIDTLLLPGISYQNRPLDPEGILSTIPAVVNGLIGVFVGQFLVKEQQTLSQLTGEWFKVICLFLIGVIFVGLGWLVDIVIPVNKDLWTSSFVLVTSGWSIVLLALFYALVDVLKWQKWAFVFVVIGTNAIIIYLASSLMNWQYFAQSLFGGVVNAAPESWQSILAVISLIAVQWLALLWLHQRKIFIRI
ncbi:transmembrane glucosamine N-acetyltransferase NagX [Shewanella olleyana]|uniref:transmembrane glucosamine N-acetyltransferase NagX n=1 Tax=Shewanella olleyana TaxID=135626 RepID=UPI003D1603EC